MPFNTSLEATGLSRSDILTIADLEKANAREIWVINTSNENDRSTIALQVSSRDGSLIHIEVPHTFVALNLADKTSPESILNSDSFRRAVSRRFLTIVTAEYAEELNSSPDAKVELEAISRGVSVGVSESVETLLGTTSLKTSSKANTKLGAVTVSGVDLDNTDDIPEEHKANQSIIQVLYNNRLSGVEKLNQLRSMSKTIKPVDAYVIKSVASNAEDEEEMDLLTEASNKMLKAFRNKYEPSYLKTARSFARIALN